MKKGLLIVIEGPDGAGTTTHARLVRELLESRGEQVHHTQQPSSWDVGKLIRQRLGSEKPSSDSLFWKSLALMFAADRLDHIENEIQPMLATGRIVLCDRYMLSSLVYQGLNCPILWVDEINKYAPTPDATFILHVPVEECARRMSNREGEAEVFEATEFQAQIHDRYKALGAARRDTDNIEDVNGVLDPNKLAQATAESILLLRKSKT